MPHSEQAGSCCSEGCVGWVYRFSPGVYSGHILFVDDTISQCNGAFKKIKSSIYVKNALLFRSQEPDMNNNLTSFAILSAREPR